MTMRLLLFSFVLGSTLALPTDSRPGLQTGRSCGYESCHQHEKDVLNVHIVAHTHDDVGWLKTVDQYYYGTRNNIQHAGVQYILDSVVNELWADPKRRFIYVESFFFFKWWSKQSDATKQKVHTLVNEGRLQFAGGAWSMNDEAAAHYHSTVDQFTFGLGRLNDTFGHCGMPTVGWQIDPFGHSREFVSMLAGMGYDGVFFGRIDYQDKFNRMNKTTMEMLWRGDDDIGKPSDLFAGVLYNMYQPPPGFCFDVFCSDAPIVTDTQSPEYNADDRVSEFLKIVANMTKAYRTNNILVTMGDDFEYQDAAPWFTNLDKLIQYTNLKAGKEGLKIKLFYSTPQCYLKAIKDANPTLPTKQDDFFPYASETHNYWTGYFASRPTTKYFERETNRYLQMAKQLQVLAGLEEHNMFVLNELKSAMGIMQHHDAITGTEKQHVAHDYERILNNAIEDALIIPRQALNKFMQGDATKQPIFSYDRCRFNESCCATSENSEQFIVTLYNHLAWQVKEPVRVPVVEGTYEVYAPNGDKITSQLVDIPQPVRNIPTRSSKATHEVVFIAYLHPLSYKSFYIKKIHNEELGDERTDEGQVNKDNDQSKLCKTDDEEDCMKNINSVVVDRVERLAEQLISLDKTLNVVNDDTLMVTRYPDDIYFENQHLKLRTNALDQMIVTTLADGSDIKFRVKFCRYDTRNSGAYIFWPDKTTKDEVSEEITTQPSGSVVNETRIETKENMFSVLRMYDGLNYIENDWVVGPINIKKVGKEIVIMYETDILNNGEFYTDSNGRQMLKRKLGYRPQWNVSITDPVSGNYYPIVNKISLHDDEIKVSVITDRAEGGSSLVEGQLEVMVHRRLVRDDGKGVGEALNETVLNGIGLVVRGTHRIFMSHVGNGTENIEEKKNVLKVDLQPQLFVSDAASLSLQDWLKLKNCFSWANALPDGLHLLTLEPWKDNTILLRLENYLELTDRQNSTIEIDLQGIFKTLKVKSFKETTLAANRWLKDVKTWSWNTENEFEGNAAQDSTNDAVGDEGFKIKLKAKQIRTFVVDYELVK